MGKRGGSAPAEDEAGQAREARLRRRDFLVTTGVGATALVLGCGDDDGGGGADGAVPADGGLPGDGGGLDGGLPGDGGGLDGGPGLDGGGGEDAGPEDAGTAPTGELPEDTEESAAFPLGVAAGDATESAVVLWTRYDGEAPLRLVVWRWDDGDYGPRIFEEAVTPAEGGFVHVAVPVSAGLRYRYAFFEMEGEARIGRSLVGRVRAAIAADAMEPLVFGAVSCTRNGRDFETLAQAGARDDLDAFLLLGDTTYNDGAASRAEFRAKWAENFGAEGYRALRSATGLYATWDDHEIDNNWNAEEIAPAVLEAATGAFFEHLPLGREAADADRVWRRRRWGRTLELFVLDCRSERLPSTREGEDAQYVSPEQLAWLQEGLAGSTAVFKVVLNSVGITDFPGLIDFGSDDRWEGYAAQREALLDHVDGLGISGVLWVAGDFHFASLGHVGSEEGERGWDQWEVLVGPGAQTANPLWRSCREPQFTFASGTNNYTELAFDPMTGAVTVRFIDGDGAVFEEQTITP